jgi:ATP-dependent DNA helicase RecG
MRPASLNPLFAPVTTLPGIGERIGRLVERLAGGRVIDLLWHLPYGLIDRRATPTIAAAPVGQVATIAVQVGEHLQPRTQRQPWRVRVHDATGEMTLVFFSARGDYLRKLLPEGEERVVSGRVDLHLGVLQMVHPDYVVSPAQREELARVEPVYGLTAGLSPKLLLKAIEAAVERAPQLAEWHDAALMRRESWPAWKPGLLAAHNPGSEADLSPLTPSRARLAYDELLAKQLALLLVRRQRRAARGRPIEGNGKLRAKVRAALPWTLTASQQQATAEIERDMASEQRMVRLLQGDVGSGKTVVALLAMLIAVEAGTQAALMAPTEILARQHYATMAPLAEAAGVSLVLLTGRDRARQRAETLAGLADGRIQLAVGTHALVQEDVEFQDLGLAVVDEQHRFGVHQRLGLASKGRIADMLVMTATPIPRTLMLAVYGDMDSSRLTEKPAGRQPIDTRTIPLERMEDVLAGISRQIDQGARIYWVCPLVEESEVVDLAAAEDRFEHLARLFPGKVGLVHGKLKAAERDRAMADFSEGRTALLVATTVIEVGVDVPEATVMVIEHAERFGLAQLHQLRGRVGRGDAKSTCLLLYAQPLSQNARARLAVLRESEDGFLIAEEDLRLRGAGEMLGTRQSGLPQMRLANLAHHSDLLQVARDDARLVIESDPDLSTPRGAALRVLLYLFEQDATVPTIRSG